MAVGSAPPSSRFSAGYRSASSALSCAQISPVSRAHAEIAYQIARLGRLIADIGDRVPDETDVADLRGVLYGLHAILRLHTAQEDEAYLSLGDDAETVGGGRL